MVHQLTKNATIDELEKAGEFIKNNLDKKSTIFLKASRSMKFERILDYLQK